MLYNIVCGRIYEYYSKVGDRGRRAKEAPPPHVTDYYYYYCNIGRDTPHVIFLCPLYTDSGVLERAIVV